MSAVVTRLVRTAARGAVVLTGAAMLLRSGGRGRRLLRSTGDRLAREVRHRSGRWQGVRYRLAGRRPDPNVPDDVLADRIRSSLGPLEHRLDLPRVHVMVEDRVALLHGDVGSREEADEIEKAVRAISGVAAVESYLHVGLLAGDTRPSQGHRDHAGSDARARLLAAAVLAGVAGPLAPAVVRAVLSLFAERLPEGERQYLLDHLPNDVRSMLEAPRRLGRPRPMRSAPDLVLLMLSPDAIDVVTTVKVVKAVLGELRALVPGEGPDIAAVLPSDLRVLWKAPVPMSRE